MKIFNKQIEFVAEVNTIHKRFVIEAMKSTFQTSQTHLSMAIENEMHACIETNTTEHFAKNMNR